MALFDTSIRYKTKQEALNAAFTILQTYRPSALIYAPNPSTVEADAIQVQSYVLQAINVMSTNIDLFSPSEIGSGWPMPFWVLYVLMNKGEQDVWDDWRRRRQAAGRDSSYGFLNDLGNFLHEQIVPVIAVVAVAIATDGFGLAAVAPEAGSIAGSTGLLTGAGQAAAGTIGLEAGASAGVIGGAGSLGGTLAVAGATTGAAAYLDTIIEGTKGAAETVAAGAATQIENRTIAEIVGEVLPTPKSTLTLLDPVQEIAPTTEAEKTNKLNDFVEKYKTELGMGFFATLGFIITNGVKK